MLPGTQHLTPTEDGADSGLRLLCSQALYSTERMSWTSLSRPPSSLSQPSQHTAETGKWTSRLCSLLTGRASDLSTSLLLSLDFVCLLVVARHSWRDLESAGNVAETSSTASGPSKQHWQKTSPFSPECSSGIDLPCSSLILHPFPLRAAKCTGKGMIRTQLAQGVHGEVGRLDSPTEAWMPLEQISIPCQ